jgi:RimJ/RimL family protein N-acetyltransferase
MVDWLRHNGVGTIVAHIHPDHHASSAVARRIALMPTRDLVDEEVRWQG